MKILTHPAMIAFGVATLCLLTLIAPLVSLNHTAVYHLHGSISSISIPVLLNLFGLWILLTLLLLLAERPGRLRIVIWSSLMMGLPWVLLKGYSVLALWPIPHKPRLAGFSACLIGLLLLWVLWKPTFLPHFERVQRLVATMLGFSALSSILILGQLLWFSWQARGLNQPRPLHQRQLLSSTHRPRTRIVWVVLDELSYQQAYERRFPGLELPAFDRLAAQSTLFTQTMPAANYTEKVIPSLMTGIQIDRIKASADGQLMLHNTATKIWQSFDPHQTVLQDALDNGYSTAIAGWYNPYCRILASVTDRCFWTFYPFPAPGLYADQPINSNLFGPARRYFFVALSLLPGYVHHADWNATLRAQFHIDEQEEVSAAASEFMADSSVDFLFLHLPVPHPEGIYNRKTSRTTTSGDSSYIDNLALADRYLAQLRLGLEQRGEWDSSAILVMGDHSWRTQILWSKQDGWTPEDQAASHGVQFDDRPVYIVKLPNQQQGVRINDRFDAVRTRALLDGIMSNRIKTPEDLAAWVRHEN
ncbi:MAG TPA: sulfatase-like hydrolase/transferase [Edaphobacter sp.]|nr:sulfatase-like hydrolase/transferase [Edaphobacter sp.]